MAGDLRVAELPGRHGNHEVLLAPWASPCGGSTSWDMGRQDPTRVMEVFDPWGPHSWNLGTNS
eukprot:7189032-Alexandrium_andersonii.AAC.1